MKFIPTLKSNLWLRPTVQLHTQESNWDLLEELLYSNRVITVYPISH